MKYLKLLTACISVSCLLITGCKKENQPAPAEVQSSRITGRAETQMSKDKLQRLRASLPAGYEKRLEKTAARLLLSHPEYRDLVRRALALEPTPCDANTPVSQWLDQELADWTSDQFFFAIVSGMLDFPTYDALLFENSSVDQTFGLSGEYTHPVNKTFKDLKRFWNIQSGGMVLAAMHGSMLQDREKVIRIDMILFGDTRAQAEVWADLIASALEEPAYRSGNHPLFTFNAFALETFNFPPFGIIPNKIVMGDGVMDGYTGIGYGDIAPAAIMAHEYGHHIQFQLGLFTPVSSPEATRRTELMADAYSAYFLSHARGASMQWKRVQQFLQVFFNIGDCGFTSDGHHGTPTQRMAAANWAYNLANDAQKQGHILTSQEFTILFEQQLPVLVAQ